MSKLEVDQIDPQSGTTLTIGSSGDTIVIPSGVNLAAGAVLTTPVLQGTSSTAGSILFKEDTDNGTNAVTLKGAAATADVTLTLPAATDTLVGKATTDTLTNKTINGSQLINATIPLNKLAAGTDGNIISYDNSGAVVAVATGNDGQVLTSAGAGQPPAFEAIPAVADNAITLAKMASGTDGNIISYDTSGNPVAVATGSSGQVLTSAGAGAVPSFATPAAGGSIVLIKTITGDSNTGSITFDNGSSGVVFNTTYDQYILRGSRVRGVTNNVYLRIQFRNSGGTITSGYRNVGSFYRTDGSETNGSGGQSTYAYEDIGSIRNDNAEYLASESFIVGAGHNMRSTMITQSTYKDNQGRQYLDNQTGALDATSTVTGLYIQMSSGNLQGVFSLYGVTK